MITELEPGADPRLAALFAAAAAPAELPLVGEPAALTAYRRAHGRSWFASLLGPRPAHLAVAALFGGVVLAGGVATAATGSLPIVGHQHTATAPTTTSASDAETAAAGDDEATDDDAGSAVDIGDAGPGTEGHPTAAPAPGSVAKGAATCTAASHGTCQAGQHGRALAAHDPHHGAAQAAARAHRRASAGNSAAAPAVGLQRPHGSARHNG